MALRKIMAILFSVIVLCTSLTATTSAETMYLLTDESISPAYEIADESISKLNIIDNCATCKSKTRGIDTISITVEQTLEKYSGWFWIWNSVDGAHWIESINASSISVVNTKSGLSSGTYRLKSVFTLTNSAGKTETITTYSEEVKIA